MALNTLKSNAFIVNYNLCGIWCERCLGNKLYLQVFKAELFIYLSAALSTSCEAKHFAVKIVVVGRYCKLALSVMWNVNINEY